jgi:Animal haem peroxidase
MPLNPNPESNPHLDPNRDPDLRCGAHTRSNGPLRRWRSRTTVAAGVAGIVMGVVTVSVTAVGVNADSGTTLGADGPNAFGDNRLGTNRSNGNLATTEYLAQLVEDARTLDGTGNNLDNPIWGAAGQIYPRQAAANYADDIGAITIERPDERYLSNRIFNDTNQNVFSENGLTHWSFVWGQFLDHTMGLRATAGGADAEGLVLAYTADDPLEAFVNDLGAISTTRSAVADGTGTTSAREQVNTVSSYLDAWNAAAATSVSTGFVSVRWTVIRPTTRRRSSTRTATSPPTPRAPTPTLLTSNSSAGSSAIRQPR